MPHLPQGVWPLHLIFRRLHSLLYLAVSGAFRMLWKYVPCDAHIAIPPRSLVWLSAIVACLALDSVRAIVLLALVILLVLVELLGETRDSRDVGVESVAHGDVIGEFRHDSDTIPL